MLLRLSLLEQGEILAENEYLFTKEKDFAPVWDLEEAVVTFTWKDKGRLLMKNTGDTAALFVYVSREREEGRSYFSDNYLTLLPGEARSIACEGSGDGISAEALNMSRKVLT